MKYTSGDPDRPPICKPWKIHLYWRLTVVIKHWLTGMILQVAEHPTVRLKLTLVKLAILGGDEILPSCISGLFRKPTYRSRHEPTRISRDCHWWVSFPLLKIEDPQGMDVLLQQKRAGMKLWETPDFTYSSYHRGWWFWRRIRSGKLFRTPLWRVMRPCSRRCTQDKLHLHRIVCCESLKGHLKAPIMTGSTKTFDPNLPQEKTQNNFSHKIMQNP